jgi:hypothetical protein
MAEENLTKVDKTPERREQERTRIKKKLFLEYLAAAKGIITPVCEKVQISREMFYQWKEKDPEFAQAVGKVTAKMNEEVVDMLMAKIFIERDGPSIRFYLERKNPEFKAHTVTEIVTGERTLEDLFDESADKKIAEGKKNGNHTATTKAGGDAGQPDVDRKAVQDKGQARIAGAAKIQRGAKLLLGKADKKKPDTEGAPKGS